MTTGLGLSLLGVTERATRYDHGDVCLTEKRRKMATLLLFLFLLLLC